MDLQTSTLEEAEDELAELNEEYNKLVDLKRQLEAEMSNNNVTGGYGNRLGPAEFNAWKQSRIRQKVNLERQLSDLKPLKKLWNDRVTYLQIKQQREDKKTENEGKILVLEHEISTLRGLLMEREEKIITLNRQLDATIRQLNAIPSTIR